MRGDTACVQIAVPGVDPHAGLDYLTTYCHGGLFGVPHFCPYGYGIHWLRGQPNRFSRAATRRWSRGALGNIGVDSDTHRVLDRRCWLAPPHQMVLDAVSLVFLNIIFLVIHRRPGNTIL